jgi:hypothetical protein
MSLKKTVAIAAAAGALAAISVPAMALENEFHGSYYFGTLFSNYNNGGSGNFVPTLENPKTNNYFEQRARIQYIAKASDDLKLVTHFEIDNQFGKSTATTANNNKTNGVGLDADVVNIEVKHAYLDFNIGKNFNTKLGIQPYKDTLKGLFIDADIPGITTTTKLGAYTLGLGFTRFVDNYYAVPAAGTGATTATRVGDLNQDLFMLDNTFAFSKDTKAALSYYFLANYATADARNLNHTLGLSGETKIGPVALSGFVAKQLGHSRTAAGARGSNHGWAANAAAKMAVGPGTARAGFLFTSGDKSTTDNDNNGWAPTTVSSYNESGLIILARNTANSPGNTDQYIRRSITNQAVAFLGYDAKLSDKLSLDGGVGAAWVPSSAGAPNNNASDFMGTELGLTASYKLYSNLTLQAQAGYMILGGYYEDSAAGAKDPENPYTMRLRARFAF